MSKSETIFVNLRWRKIYDAMQAKKIQRNEMDNKFYCWQWSSYKCSKISAIKVGNRKNLGCKREL